jgi:predicted nucleic-acid-binding protein
VRITADTNVLVRYPTWDDEEQASEAARAMESADQIVVPTVVLCEVAWVLRRAYRYSSAEIIGVLSRLVTLDRVEIERPVADAGIAMLSRGADFADGVIRYEADRAKCDRLVTFDQRFARLIDPDRVTLLGSRPEP